MGSSIDIYRYKLPLIEPLVLKGQTLYARMGLILRVVNAEGNIGFGDCAPLPGFSHEMIEDVCALPIGSAVEQTLPSLCFAYDMATTPLRTTCRHVPVNALIIINTPEEAAERARRYCDRGFRAIKLKVGRNTIQADVELVRAVSQAIKGRCTVRLDANRAWDYDSARTFVNALADCPIEYLEEPLADPMQLSDFIYETGACVALDESLLDSDQWKPLLRARRITAVVLKPTLIGGLKRVLEIVGTAHKYGAKVVISACFESGVGIALLARLAASLDAAATTPVGLDTYRWLADDILGTPLSIENGVLDLVETEASLHTIDWTRLEPLRHA